MKKTRERYKIVSIVLFVLMGFILSGCSRKEIPEGISEEVYEKGVKTSELVHDVLDGKTNLDEFANQFDDISKELVDIIQKEYDVRQSVYELDRRNICCLGFIIGMVMLI